MPLLTSLRNRRQDARIDRLAALPLLRGCTPAELIEVARLTDTVTLAPGRALSTEGCRPAQAFVVLSGRVAISCCGRRLGEAGSGTPVGTTALLDRWMDSRTVTALEEIEALVLTRRALSSLLREVPLVARPLLRDVRCVAPRDRHPHPAPVSVPQPVPDLRPVHDPQPVVTA